MCLTAATSGMPHSHAAVRHGCSPARLSHACCMPACRPQAAILSGEKDEQVTDLLLLDVTPLSLGIGVGECVPANSVCLNCKDDKG